MDEVFELDEDEVIRSICRDSFEEFVKEFWSELVADKLKWNWHMSLLCSELQKIAERVFLGLPKEYDFVCNVPPSTSKSTIASILFVAWIWTRMPHAQIIAASYSQDLAMDLSSKTRKVVNSAKYKRLFPEIEWTEEQDSKKKFVNKHGGWRYCTGTKGTLTGLHAHFQIIDDPIDPRRAYSEVELSEVNRFMRETLPSRVTDAEVSPLILIMQRLHQDDPTALVLKTKEAIKHICLPATNEFPIIPKELEKHYLEKDGLLDPVRLSRKALEQKQKEMTKYSYAGQYGQKPVPLGGGMFLTQMLQIGKMPPDYEIARTVRFWDKAATAAGGAFSVGVKMSITTDNFIIIHDIMRMQVDSASREAIMKKTAIRDGTGVIVGIEQEGGSGGKESAERTVRNLSGHSCRILIPHGDKSVRADPFSTQVNNGSVYLVQAAWNEEFIQELMHFPESTYKDQVDACAGAFTLLTQIKRHVGAIRPKKPYRTRT